MMKWNLLSPPLMAAALLLSTLPLLMLAILMCSQNYSTTISDYQLMELGDMSLYFPLLVDKTSVSFSAVVVLISFSVMLFTTTYMSGDPNLEYFIYMVMLFVMSMNLLVFIPHLAMLLLGWDGLGLTSFLLVIYYQNDSSLGAGMVTGLTNRIGDCLLILAIAWSMISAQWSYTTCTTTNGLLWMTMMMIMIGSMTKSAQLPFSAWLPAAMAAPTPVSSLVHSSTLVTAGVYLLIRFYPSLTLFDYFCFFMFYCGVMTCLMASMSGIYENDMKKIIALSTLSQLGVMMMAIGIGYPSLAFFHLVTHALFKALLFICAGTIIHSKQDNQDIRLMGNIWNSMPVTCTCLNGANLALCGIPFMAGFYSKDLIIESFMMKSFPITTALLMLLSVTLTSAYSIRLSLLTLWTPFKSNTCLSTNDESIFTYVPCGILLSGGVMGGAAMSWMMMPSVNMPILPLFMKMLVLSMIILIGMMTFILVNQSTTMKGYQFMGSMWFLTLITSPPMIQPTFNLGWTMTSQELTWMEIPGGKGALSLFSKSSQTLQHTQGMTFSLMFSLFTITLLLMVTTW